MQERAELEAWLTTAYETQLDAAAKVRVNQVAELKARVEALVHEYVSEIQNVYQRKKIQSKSIENVSIYL
jgi:hypothetical protein